MTDTLFAMDATVDPWRLLDKLPVPPGRGLRVAPLDLLPYNAFIEAYHRHSAPELQVKMAIRIFDGDQLVGVAGAGRPKARMLDDGLTMEITRVCVLEDAPRNACSKAYGALCRAAAAQGYVRAVTYTTEAETGASVAAAGFVRAGTRRAGTWDCESRPRDRGHHELVGRVRWERRLA